ncbi:MAG TPA: hypothetical protein DCR95_11680 [Desulfobacter sp.]|nr:hypothetical protein [Desulfobacter sp.]
MNEWAFFSHPWAQAWGLTLLHSLWQGGIIAAGLSLALWWIRDQNAQRRHNWAAGALFLFLLATTVTFWQVLKGLQQLNLTAPFAENDPSGSEQIFLLLYPGSFDHPALLKMFILFWCAGVILMTLKACTGLYCVRSLRLRDVQLLPRFWQDQITRWFEQWQLHIAVPVLVSARIQTPMVVGIFRQTLLLPVGFLTTLPPDYIKAILAHEVAHLLRKDALVNLLQTVMEVFFFYHPAVWWISSQVRTEREFCCDDFAVHQCGRPMDLARALLELQQLQNKSLALAPVLSAAGRLQQRVKRLFLTKENTMDLRQKIVAIAFVLAAGLMILPLQSISNSKNEVDDTKKKTEKVEVTVEVKDGEEKHITITSSDTLKHEHRKLMMIKEDNGEKIEIKMENGKVVSVLKDGKPVPVEEMDKYSIEVEPMTWEDEKEGPHQFTVHVTTDEDTAKRVKIIKMGKDEEVFYVTDKDSLKKKIMIVHESKDTKRMKKEAGIVGERVREELAKDGIIKNKNNAVNFKLGKDGLFINGTKQSAEKQTKYEHLLQESMGLEGKGQFEINLKFEEN